jgi:hypothetical protein
VNRHQRRAAAADLRRAGKTPTFFPMKTWTDYLAHLPRVPLNAPELPGRRYYTIEHHDPDCRSLRPPRRREDCDCNNVVKTKVVEPMRS